MRWTDGYGMIESPSEIVIVNSLRELDWLVCVVDEAAQGRSSGAGE